MSNACSLQQTGPLESLNSTPLNIVAYIYHTIYFAHIITKTRCRVSPSYLIVTIGTYVQRG